MSKITLPNFKTPKLNLPVFEVNTISYEKMKTDNSRLKRELGVREKAIEQLEEKIEHLKSTTVPRQKYSDLKVDHDHWELVAAEHFKEWKKVEERYQREHSIVINLDAELENTREQLRQSRNNEVRMMQELEHLRPLMVLYMKEKVEG